MITYKNILIAVDGSHEKRNGHLTEQLVLLNVTMRSVINNCECN